MFEELIFGEDAFKPESTNFINDAIAEYNRQMSHAIEMRLARILCAHGVDPDDRSEGWEARAREILKDFEIIQISDDIQNTFRDTYSLSVEIVIRKKER